MRCTAPWYELNISAPDDYVSACCYYSKETEKWSEAEKSMDSLWNAKSIQKMRQINSGGSTEKEHGCSTCHYFQNVPDSSENDSQGYFSFETMPKDLSKSQRENWEKAKKCYENREIQADYFPLRIYGNFTFTCNLSCTMCHQVPRRTENKKHIKASEFLAWKEALKAALSVDIIGGEPFANPEALKVIRSIAADDELQHTRLTIFTNGTLHHKHMKTLIKKRKLSFVISLDAINETYEKLRVNAKWEEIEKGILEILKIKNSCRPEWTVTTNAAIHRSCIEQLPDFASWHVKHNIETWFYDFINAYTNNTRGFHTKATDDTFISENLIHNPILLEDMPNWRTSFREAIEILNKGGLINAANSLKHFYQRLSEEYEKFSKNVSHPINKIKDNDWKNLLSFDNLADFEGLFNFSANPQNKGDNYVKSENMIQFGLMRNGDHFSSKPFYLTIKSPEQRWLRLIAEWNHNFLGMRRARINIEIEGHTEYVQMFSKVQESKSRIIESHIAELPLGTNKVRLIINPAGEKNGLIADRVFFDAKDENIFSYELNNVGNMVIYQASKSFIKTGKLLGLAKNKIHSFINTH